MLAGFFALQGSDQVSPVMYQQAHMVPASTLRPITLLGGFTSGDDYILSAPRSMKSFQVRWVLLNIIGVAVGLLTAVLLQSVFIG